jgi:hypothetical protein
MVMIEVTPPAAAARDADSMVLRKKKRFHHRHAYRNPHFHLLLDHALRTVGNLRGDFDAAVHRAGMHDQRVLLGYFQFFGVEPVVAEIFAHRGHEGASHALALQAQHHHHVGILQAFFHRVIDLGAHVGDAGGEKGCRSDHTDTGAHLVEKQDIGAGNA